ncbi:MAG: hypothetical protein SFT81_05275 [Candidatus Caenarcaniphilales bacterium]|nr:hypothetical protein [Candidatus Caenarcaniphilales bacterium]
MKQIETQIPCIIDQGLIFNKRDMVRILQGLDRVEYSEVLEGQESERREGYLVEIFEDENEATIFFNRRIHININSFEYLQINHHPVSESHNKASENSEDRQLSLTVSQTQAAMIYTVELVLPGGRKIILRPLSDPLENPAPLQAEVEIRRRHMSAWDEVVVDSDEE